MIEPDNIYCGDCLKLMREMPDKSVDLVLTDPPYGLGRKLHDGGTWSTNPIYDAMLIWDDKPVSQEYIKEIFRVSKDQIIWGGHLYSLPISRCWLSWRKNDNMPTLGDFELAWTSFDKVSKEWTERRNPDGKRVHPTQKPLSLFNWVLRNYSKENDLILDPFLGSGTTAVAAIRTGRRYIGMEIDPTYFEIARKRIDLEKQQLKLELV